MRARLADAGVEVAAGAPHDAIRVLVGPWAHLRADPAAAQLERGPQLSGVYAKFTPAPAPPDTRSRLPWGTKLPGSAELVDSMRRRAARRFGPGVGLVAATRRFDAPPVWLVTGATARGVRAAADLLDAPDLRDRYAVATEAGRQTPLPVAPAWPARTAAG